MSTLEGTVTGSAGEPASPPAEALEGLSAVFHAAFGVLLPLAALIIELSARWCASALFDPIPTVFHAALVAIVVVSNGACWSFARMPNRRPPRLLGWANGAAIGIAFWYSLVFAPLAPLSVIAILLFLMGFLSLSPMFALLTAALLRLRLGGNGAPFSRLSLWGGLVLGLSAFIALGMSESHTQSLMMTAAGEGREAANAIRRLRAHGNRDELLRACYVRPQKLGDPYTWLAGESRTLSTDEARRLWYRVHGTSFADQPMPDVRTGRTLFSDRDMDLLSEGPDDALSLRSSSFEGSLDPDAALGYLEWTWVVTNSSDFQREGLATVALPPGAVVSRLTLWVNGEPREAAFAARAKASQAYERVRSARRDPVLVTTAGQDRIRVAFFPVPPKGDMKFRIGMTVPMAVVGGGEARVGMPWILESNLSKGETPLHAIHVESKRMLRPAGVALATEVSTSGGHVVRGVVKGGELGGVEVAAERDASVRMAHAPDPGNPGRVCVQRFADRAAVPARLAIVVDGSIGLAPAREAIAAVLEGLPGSLEFSLAMAGVFVESRPLVRATASARGEAAARVRAFEFAGGCDSERALEDGWDELERAGGGVVLWISGPQPFHSPKQSGALLSRMAIPGKVSLQLAQIGPGRNHILDAASDSPRFHAAAFSSPQGFAAWTAMTFGPSGAWTVVRGVEDVAAFQAVDSKLTTDHLARLVDADRCSELLRAGAADARAEAVRIAVARQIVVPVTGAVVLESVEQELAAGVQQGDPSRVPSVPEPGVFVLAAVAAAAMLARRLRKARA